MIEFIAIEPGGMADYRVLAGFHYRGGHPGLVTGIWRAVVPGESVVGRFVRLNGRRADGGHAELAGVIVVSRPRLACRLRDCATGGRYRSAGARHSAASAAALVNREVRTISRVIIDPRFRGMGLGVRLVRHVLAAHEGVEGVALTEALAAMGAVSAMFDRAGMMRYQRPRQGGPAYFAFAHRAAGNLERNGASTGRAGNRD